MFDLIGISIIVPYINLISNPNSKSLEYFKLVLTYFDYNLSVNNMIIFIGLLLSTIFFLKAVVSIFVYRMIINFGFEQRKKF